MKHCNTPCQECPFLKTSLAGWLSTYTPEELHRLVMAEVSFPCHMTHEEDIEFNQAGTEYPLCAGALRYMKKGCKLPRRADLSALMVNITTKECDNILSIPEFFKHHTKSK